MGHRRRLLGLSEAAPSAIRRAAAVHQIAALDAAIPRGSAAGERLPEFLERLIDRG